MSAFTKKLEKFIRNYMRENRIPGLAMGIIKDHEIIYANGIGYRNLQEGLPMTPDTLIGIGSITKSFTAFGIMKLIEEGKIALEDSVSKYLNNPPFSNHPEIKIYHMLSHSTGIPASDAGLAQMFYHFQDFKNIYPAGTKEDFLAHIADAEDYTVFKPKEHFFYNNDMYTCLGFIIEDLTGQSYAKYIRKKLLKPLEMDRAVYTKDAFDEDPKGDTMMGYLPHKQNDKPSIKAAEGPMYNFLEPPGGLYVSVRDMLKYAQMLLQKGVYKGQRLLSEESVNILWKPILNAPYGYGDNPKYALGWVIDENVMGETMIHHGGGVGTSCTFLGLIPALNIAIYVGQNCCTGSAAVSARAAMAYLLDKTPEKEIREVKIGNLMKEISGKYKAPYDLYETTIQVKNNALMAKIEIDDGSMEVPLMPKNLESSKLEFSICLPQAPPTWKVVFLRDEETHLINYLAFDRYLYKKEP